MPNEQLRPSGQAQQIETIRSDILAKLPGRHTKSFSTKLDKEFLVQQVNLPEVRLSRVFCYARKVLHLFAEVGIPINPTPTNEPNFRYRILRERVRRG